MGWGTQPLRIPRSRFPCVLALNNPPVSRYHMSPLWGFGYLVHAACYKHAAPLGLNAPVLLSSDGLGNPTPTNSIPLGLNTSPFLTLSLSPLRIIGDSDKEHMSPSYKHVAPLGLNARVLLSSSGLGNPTPTNSTVRILES